MGWINCDAKMGRVWYESSRGDVKYTHINTECPGGAEELVSKYSKDLLVKKLL